MIIEHYMLGHPLNADLLQEQIEILKSKLPPLSSEGEFYIRSFQVTHLIEGSGFLSMSASMTKAVILRFFENKESETFNYTNEQMQLVFPEWVIDPYLKEERTPVWEYQVKLGRKGASANLKMIFYVEELLSKEELATFIKANVNWNCAMDAGIL